MAEYPVSIKGVVVAGDKILLALNDRNGWELPGGRIEPGESPLETVRREVFEEAGVRVTVSPKPLDSYLFEVLGPGGPSVFLVTYSAVVEPQDQRLVVSDEHLELAWFAFDEALALPNLPVGYKNSIRAAGL